MRKGKGGGFVRHWKWLALLAALWLCAAGAAAEEVLCVSTETCAALLDLGGGEIVPPGAYSDIYEVVENERYALGAEADGRMRYALADSSGTLLTGAEYDLLAADGDVILFRQGGLYGAMDMDGNLLLTAAYTQLVSAGDGAFLALTTDPNDDTPDEILRIAGGEAVSTGIRTASGLEPLCDGLMPFREPDTELYGYVDSQGAVAIEAQFSYAGAFEDGVAHAAAEGLSGAINREGDWLIRPEYDFLEWGDGIIVGLQGRETCVVYAAENGVERFRVEGANLSAAVAGACAIVMDDEALYAYSADGTLILQTSRTATLSPGDGGQLILSDGDWGTACVAIVEPDGTVLDRRDQHLLALSDDRYAFITMRVASYSSDALGTIRYSVDYDSLRYGLMDTAGREILPAEYLEIRSAGTDRYLTIAEDGLRLTDEEGNVLWSHLTEE